METRSRKRRAAEASSTVPSSSTPASSKRAHTNVSSSSSSIADVTPVPTTRSRSSAAAPTAPPMDSTREPASRRNRRSRKSDKGGGSSNDKGKGKEKEDESRVRERESDAVLSVNLESMPRENVDENDSDDGDDGAGILNHNISSSALRGLLSKYGAGLEDLLQGSGITSTFQNGSLKKILAGLRADGEEAKQVEALNQLCHLLSIASEDSLSVFSADSFVPLLVGFLNHENNPEVMLLAARALTHLCDVLPSSCEAVVHYGALTCFVARLLTIEYMDLAEQSLQALNKISQEHPTACLRAGALMAVLSYLDFFSTGVQRVALSTAANMCKKLPSDAADFVMEAVPLLTNLLQYQDSKVLEHASVCLTRIAEAFTSSPDKLDELCNHGLVSQTAALISASNPGGGQASLSVPTYTGLIRLLSTCSSGSPLGSKTLLLLGISGTLKDILSGTGVSTNASVSPALSRPADQIFEIVNLANELLPPLPQGPSSTLFALIVKKSVDSSSGKQAGAKSNSQDVSVRQELLDDQPELLKQFGMDLLPVLIQVYGSSINSPVRHKCLSVIVKLMYFSTAEMIQSLSSTTNISSFLAGVLACQDPHALMPALQIAKILMEKLPEMFSKMFLREGVVHAVDQLILAGNPIIDPTEESSAEKGDDLQLGTSSRSRRYRRRSGNSNPEGNSLDEPKNPVSVGSPPNTILNANGLLLTTICPCAKAFKDTYFPSEPGSIKIGVTDDLLRLKSLCAKLNFGIDDQKKAKGKSKSSGSCRLDNSANKEEYLIEVVSELLVELSKGDGVSTFEFIGSGVVEALLNYFSCGHFSKQTVSEVNLPKLRQQSLRRFKSFVALALPPMSDQGSVLSMTVLVHKLQNALSSLENYPVVLSHSSGSSDGSAQLSSGLSSLSALTQPLKLCLRRAQGEKSLRDYSSNLLLIDPLARLAAVEEFLWPRVQQSVQKPLAIAGNSDSGKRATSPSASTPASKKEEIHEKCTSSSKGKGKAITKTAQEESRGPQTRNAVRRRAAQEKDLQVKSVIVSGDSSSEQDEESNVSPMEMAEDLLIEDDDISEDEHDDHDHVLEDDRRLPFTVPNEVLDVKLDAAANASATSEQTNPASGSRNRAAFARGTDSTDSNGLKGAISFAAAAKVGLGTPKLIFSAGGRELNRDWRLYQAVRQQHVLDNDEADRHGRSDSTSGDGSRLGSDVYTITFRRADGEASSGGSSSTNKLKSTKLGSSSKSNPDTQLRPLSLLDSILQGELPCDLEKSNPTYNILALLRVLECLNQLAPRLRAQIVSDSFAEGKITSPDDLSITGVRVSPEEFISSKLTPKLARQMQDALSLSSGSLPPWCYQLTKACAFLFPFEIRRQYFYSTAFGLSRALSCLQQQQGANGQGSANERDVRVRRLPRHKVRIARNCILDSAVKVMEMLSSQKSVLEVEYFGEVGTGLGPTLEFYTLLSRELQKSGLQMWRSNSSDKYSIEKDANRSAVGDGELVRAPLGLFPLPWPPNSEASEGGQFYKAIEYFRLLGRVIAKAFQDGRLLDLPLSTALYKLVLGQELDLYDIISFDAEVGKTLQELHALVSRKHYLESIDSGNRGVISKLCFRGVLVEDLYLDFTLPGYPDYVLKPKDENVDINNLEEYISLVVDATVKTGIERQMEAFRSGFNQVFDIASLQIFTPHELDYLLCGIRDQWESETLADHIKFDHGYTATSPAILNLLEVMGEFTAEQQQAFCRFVTGASRLPPGGMAALNPKLTIVRKHSLSVASNGIGPAESPDNDLPSVMTCANYLKLPPYSTKEVMRTKLLYAINEGQGSFDLS